MANKRKQEDMEELINRVCSTFCEKIESSIEAKLEQLDQKLESKIDKVVNSLKDVRELASINKEKINTLEDRVEVLEQQSKRFSLRFVGLNYIANTDDLIKTIIKLIKSKMNINCSNDDIQQAFYINKNNKNNTVLVQFTNVSKRDEVFNAKKILKDSKILIFEDLTKSRYQLLSEAKKKHGNKNAWSIGGKIFAWDDKQNSKVQLSLPLSNAMS